MSLRIYVFSLLSTIIIATSLWILLFLNVNPYLAPGWIIFLWYLCIFSSLAAIFALIGFYLKVWLNNREVIFAHLVPTLRQSIFISFFLVGILFFQQLRVLSWAVVLTYIFAIILIELFFRAKSTVERKR